MTRHVADEDLRFLQRQSKPAPLDGPVFSAIDLFAGCGGMSVGLEEAARRLGGRLEVSLAIETEDEFASVYSANLDVKEVIVRPVEDVFSGNAGDDPDCIETTIKDSAGAVDILVGGPPCQGHSDLNNHTRRSDPRNRLYLRMARAAEVIQPSFVVIENVATVHLDRADVVSETRVELEKLGYASAIGIVDMRSVGVPQRRRRHILIASAVREVDPAIVLDELTSDLVERDLRWAIGDLEAVEGTGLMDRPSNMSAENRKRVSYLFAHGEYELPNRLRPKCHRNGGHSYKSMYGRLRWDQPAQTITTGFGSMGQGRYVHPSQPRTITPHEAARIQTFPDWFDFGDSTTRTRLATMIGNAVPPLLMARLGTTLLSGLARDH